MSAHNEQSIGFLISDTARLMRTVFDRRVREIGLTRAQWIVLTRLNRHPGASQSELAEMMEMEKASAGRLIDRLEAKGWVERRPDPADRRINRIYLSSNADRVRKRLTKIAETTVADSLTGLSAAEVAALTGLMGRIKGRLSVMAGGDKVAEGNGRAVANGARAGRRANGKARAAARTGQAARRTAKRGSNGVAASNGGHAELADEAVTS